MEQNGNNFAPEAPADESASPPQPEPADNAAPDFDPVPLRYRSDGLTPQRQREYVEALADCGIAREAARRIGVSEQAIARVRRRADARAFDLACEAAQRLGARNIRATAWERAIQGTVRRHYYHGELKSEEVVFDNRLLIYLLGKTAHLAEPPPETEAVIDNWERWMAAIEQGLPPPVLSEAEGPVPEPQGADLALEDDGEEEDEEFSFTGDEVWQDDDGIWWTSFPPSADFYGREEGIPGEEDYERTLSAAELDAVEAGEDEEVEEELELECARRDAFFGFKGERWAEEQADKLSKARDRKRKSEGKAELRRWAGGREREAAEAPAEAQVSSPREAETNETSVHVGERVP